MSGNKPRPGLPLKQNTWVTKPAVSSAPPKANPAPAKPTRVVTSAKPVQSQQAPKSTFEDFPTLGSIGGSLTRTLNHRGLTTEEALASAPAASSQQQKSNVQLVKSTGSGTVKPEVSNRPIDSSDFPSLGGRKTTTPGAKPSQWGPKPKPAEDEKTQGKPDQSEPQFMVAKLKKKKRNAGNKGLLEDSSGSREESDVEAGVKTGKKGKVEKARDEAEVKQESDADADKLDEDWDDVQKISQVKSKKKRGQQSTKEEKVRTTQDNRIDHSQSTGAKHTTKPAAEAARSSIPELPPHTTDTSVPSLTSTLVGLPVTDSDFPAVTTSGLEDSSLPSEFAAVRLDDFPPLSFGKSSSFVPAASSEAAPPPGFSKPEVSLISAAASRSNIVAPPPPGFGSVTHQPPPTLAPPLKATSASEEPAQPKSYDFSAPPNFMERNQNLISTIQRYVKDDESKFAEFKSCSGQFRTDKMGPYDYYDRCSNLLGKDNFRTIFPELLVLLPDINKQQELLTAHNAALRLSEGKKSGGKKKKTAMWASSQGGPGSHEDGHPLVECSTCGQVVLQSDLSAHRAEHRMQSDFPSLGSTAQPRAAHGMSAWVKAK